MGVFRRWAERVSEAYGLLKPGHRIGIVVVSGLLGIGLVLFVSAGSARTDASAPHAGRATAAGGAWSATGGDVSARAQRDDGKFSFNDLLRESPLRLSTTRSRSVRLRIATQHSLEEAVADFPGVQSARVIIDTPPERLVVGQAQRGTANVAVRSTPGVPLSTTSMRAIAGLVASASRRLSPEDVVVVDTGTGRTVRGTSIDEAQAPAGELAFRREIESRLVRKAVGALAYLGTGSVIAEAHVDLDWRKTEIESKTFDPSETDVQANSSYEKTSCTVPPGRVLSRFLSVAVSEDALGRVLARAGGGGDAEPGERRAEMLDGMKNAVALATGIEAERVSLMAVPFLRADAQPVSPAPVAVAGTAVGHAALPAAALVAAVALGSVLIMRERGRQRRLAAAGDPDRLRVLVRREPRRSASVLSRWMCEEVAR